MINDAVKKDINKLADIFYGLSGHQAPHGYDFETAPDAKARAMWGLAKASYDFWALKFIKAKT